MTDWASISIQEFDDLVLACDSSATGVSSAIIERLPFVFESKSQYLAWRDALAEGFDVDGRDITLVGSAATGRSLNSRKRFGVFNGKSDIDIAVVSSQHFDVAWRWFRDSDPNIVTGLDETGKEKFRAHRSQYIYDGVVAAEYFLSYFPFGPTWSSALQRTQRLLPRNAQGRLLRVRIYRDARSLRDAQRRALESYLPVLRNKRENQESEIS